MKKWNIEVLCQMTFLGCLIIWILNLLYTKNILNYVHPRFIILLILSCIAMSFMMCSLFNLIKFSKKQTNSHRLLAMIMVIIVCWWNVTTTPITTRVEAVNINKKQDVNPVNAKYQNLTEIRIADSDYLNWFYDVHSNLNQYVGKTVIFNAKVFKVSDDYLLPIRNIMVCCAADIAALGINTKVQQPVDLNINDWVKITATIQKEYSNQFQQEVPYLELINYEKIETIKNELIYP